MSRASAFIAFAHLQSPKFILAALIDFIFVSNCLRLHCFALSATHIPTYLARHITFPVLILISYWADLARHDILHVPHLIPSISSRPMSTTGPSKVALRFIQYINRLTRTTPIKIATLQLNVEAVMGVPFGQTHQKNANAAYASPLLFMAMPKRPRLQRHCGRLLGLCSRR